MTGENPAPKAGGVLRAAAFARQMAPAPMHNLGGPSVARAQASAYDAANRTMWDARWNPVDQTPDAELATDLRRLRERCIDLVRNDPLAYGVIDTIAHGVVGRGPRLRSLAGGEIAATIQRLFSEWTETAGWDGMTSWSDLCRGAVHASCLSGDVLILWPDVGDGTGPRVDLVDARRIDTPTDKTPEVASARLGVGYDAYGRVVGYYVATGETYSGPRTEYRFFARDKNGRLNARLFKRPSVMRPRQSRAVPMFASAASDLKDLREYRRTEVRRAQQAAKITTIVTTPNPKEIADAFENLEASGSESIDGLQEMLGRSFGNTPDGSMMVLGLGESAQTVTPPQVSGGTGEYIDAMLRAIASCTGLPFEEAFRLYAKLNYSNARTIRLMAKSAYRDWRDDLELALCRPTLRLLVQYWWATGALGRIAWTPDLYAHAWDWDEMEWVDPGKEVSANAEAMETNQRSLQDICASQGKDWETVIAQNVAAAKLESELRKAAGLPEKGAAPAPAPAMQNTKTEGSADE